MLLRPFPGSRAYWEARYAGGDTSGHGSEEHLAIFKAEVLNRFVVARDISSVVEFGCGDGNQLIYLEFPEYLGFDVSHSALVICERYYKDDPSKTFRPVDDYTGELGDLVISLDVVQHLVEDQVYHEYMQRLFAAARSYVVIYSGNFADRRIVRGSHVRYREFMSWVADYQPDWELIEHIPNRFPRSEYVDGSLSEFFIYGRAGEDSGPIRD